MLRKPAFWIAFVLISAAALVFALRNFSHAFPIVSVPIEMTREQALGAARQLADERGWGPAEPRLAASFTGDDAAQVFVELAAGGAERWRRLLSGEVYQPYTWSVRLFQPGETTETRVELTPQGSPYGFSERLPEDEPGAALSVDEARAIAVAGAAEWAVDLALFDAAEESQDTRPSGRVDHELVYQRRDADLGEGEVRLTLRVAGDRFTGLRHWVKVPEAFSRRYAEMRSANNAIALVASVVGLIGYLLVVGGIAFFVFLRQRWLLWRPAFAWGFFIGVLQGLTFVNQWPLLWMGYDTAVDPGAWSLQNAAVAVGAAIGTGLMLGFSFLVAEALTRKAFPRHVQLWKAWSPGAAASRPLWGFTAAGYLFVALFFAYEVILYFLTTRGLGWWSPASDLADPNVLATWLPWLPPIAISAQAGMWEECLFRAVPIAAAALVGQRLGLRRPFIVGAVILQALVFGGGHANYPAQPSYARVVELILPAVVFALLYLAFGLVPAIVMHYAYDVVWIALPVMVTDAEGTLLDKVLVVVLGLAPLWVLVVGRLRTGRLAADVPEELRNGAWEPPPVTEESVAAAPPRPLVGGALARALIVLGAGGLVLWALVGPRELESARLGPDRAQALATARDAFEKAGVPLGPPWRLVAAPAPGRGEGHEYAWREGGPEAFRALRRFLGDLHWNVRVVRFEGDVAAERAESWGVHVRADGTTSFVRHVLPQARPGAELSREDALALAEAAARERHDVEPAELELVRAEPTKQPARMDWELSWKDARDWTLPAGEGRVTVWIAGDEVVDSSRWLKVPEEWQRAERERSARMQVAQLAGGGVLALLVLGAVVGAIVGWARGTFSLRTAALFFVVTAALAALGAALSWPLAVAGFSTEEPFAMQAGVWALQQGLGVVLPAGLVALFAGFAQAWTWPVDRTAGAGLPVRLAAAFGAGALVAGLVTASRLVSEPHSPPWGQAWEAGGWAPVIHRTAGTVQGTLLAGAVALLLFVALDRLTSAWTRRRALAVGMVAVLGLAVAGTQDPFDFREWLLRGVGVAAGILLLHAVVIRRDPALVPAVVAGASALGLLDGARQQAHFAALPAGVAGAILVIALGAWWSRRVAAASAARGAAQPDVAPEGAPGVAQGVAPEGAPDVAQGEPARSGPPDELPGGSA